MDNFKVTCPNNPCNGCKNRIPPTKEHNGCHATCDIYKSFSEKRKKENAEKFKKRQSDWQSTGLRHERLNKIRKKMKGNGGR